MQASAASAPSIAATVEALNTDGLEQFASLPARWGLVPDVVVSPTMTWYVERFRDPDSLDAQTRELISELRSAGISFRSTVSAARGKSRYSQSVANDEERALGITTNWDTADVRGKFALILDADLQLSADFSAPADERVNRSGKIRAVQVDDPGDAQSLFVLHGDAETIANFRRNLTYANWSDFVDEFSPGSVIFEDFRLQQLATSRGDISRGALFGLRFFYSFYSQNTMATNYRFSADPSGFHAEIEASVAGMSPPKDDGSLRSIGSWTSTPSRPLPITKSALAAPAMLYILRDNATGAILLMGEHAAQN